VVAALPVTVGEFGEFVRTEAYFRVELWDHRGPRPDRDGFGDAILRRIGYSAATRLHPVGNVSWFEADAYCRWRRGQLPLSLACADARARVAVPGGIAEWCRNWYNRHTEDEFASPSAPPCLRVVGFEPPCADPGHRDERLGFRLDTSPRKELKGAMPL
jgi:formylglycine-generating enzyme required for sulfatase activity